jgi:hypothetical protein
MNKVVLHDLVGLVFDTSMVLEYKFEDGLWTPLDKIDKYFCEAISSLLRNNDKP